MSELRCSDAARLRGDRWVGTAPPARRWFLVGQAGDWGPTAWQGLHADPRTKELLEPLLARAGARLMLVRRPGRAPRDEPPGWGIVDRAATVPVRWGDRRSDADLLEAARTLLDPLPTAAAGQPMSLPGIPGQQATPPGQSVTRPGEPELLLVCAHGRKDRCCAVRGRPVAAAAAERWPAATWECTHTGGDRFAGNLVVLPDGACYGGLDPDDVEPVVGAHLAGRVDPAHLRGPTGYTPPIQAAVVAAHERWGPLAWSAVTARAQAGTPEHWTVDLQVAGIGSVRAHGHTEVTAAHKLTCDALEPARMALPIVDGWDGPAT
ncbi:hypothetical protein GA0111570_105275 [Raineyella antarctica]|uniref:Sucrase/ferredoxin-like n=1 Tax=Raineyella antarctica TaxID=1577474 RepID=A0A1G6GYC8_9ACTN|nr:sucrase ferredoxin [Raineyella antarctica]SDB86944.1 hypothetical protein GA0111570_105275 [Raineyella antarctica]